jgi:TonB family protein
MKEYRLYIAVAISAACHAAMLLPGWSYTPASAMLRRGDNAVTLELVESVEAVARPTSPAPTPVTRTEQAIQRQVENAAEQLAAAVRELSKIKLPDPPKPPEPQPPVAVTPPEPVIELVIEATQMQIRRSATNLAERVRDLAEAVQEASRQYAEVAARQKQARQKQIEQAEQAGQIAQAGQPAGAPALPGPASKQTRGQGNAEVNSRASNGGSGTQGVSAGTQGVGSLSPVYPPICRRRGEEGVVKLEWQVLASGKCGWVRIMQSSGNDLLDQSAVEAVKNAAFRPAASAGRAVDSAMACTFRFTLTDAGY